MKIVFVIGGIGSGKSTVVRIFKSLGADVVNLDSLGHRALLDKKLIQQLQEAFGEGILTASGEVDRKKLAAQAFANTQNHQILNSITFPKISQLLQQELADMGEGQRDEIIVVEASSFDNSELFPFRPNAVVAVLAPADIRITRAVASGFTRSDAIARNNLQVSDEERKKWADYCISNVGSFEDLEKSTKAVWELLLKHN